MNELEHCTLCPRQCGANREKFETGYCNMTATIKVARAALHMWEEPCISGKEGSGTVFFSGCTLGCIFCQNREISRGTAGKEITIARLGEIFLELQEKGARNINLVTPTQFIPQIKEALLLAKENGLKLPIVYNTSGYERAESLRCLDGFVDVYLPDFKYMSTELARKYSKAENYPTYAKEALKEMVRQTGRPKFNEDGMMVKGVLVRHLALPGCKEDSKAVIRYLYETYGDDIFISIMNQYTPVNPIKEYKQLNRKLTTYEYRQLIDYAISIGVTNGFKQEGTTAKESFIPPFDLEGVEKRR